MRDITLLAFTLHAMRDLGDGGARIVEDGRDRHRWFAGPQPLSEQAVQDLIADGWLHQSADRRAVRIDAWPAFAPTTEGTHHG